MQKVWNHVSYNFSYQDIYESCNFSGEDFYGSSIWNGEHSNMSDWLDWFISGRSRDFINH